MLERTIPYLFSLLLKVVVVVVFLMGTQNGHNVPFLEFASFRKRKRKAMKRIKQFIKSIKRVIKQKSCHLVPKMVIDLPFEARKVEGSLKYRRRERVPKAGSRRFHFLAGVLHWIESSLLFLYPPSRINLLRVIKVSTRSE